jgi:hypothetical protein
MSKKPTCAKADGEERQETDGQTYRQMKEAQSLRRPAKVTASTKLTASRFIVHMHRRNV